LLQCLPATAQVAAQEGEFLAHLFNAGNLTAEFDDGGLLLPPRVDNKRAQLIDSVTALAIKTDKFIAPFQFLDMGILAYTGVSLGIK
jgi:NADH dehydrogenase FAD-containing subunit